MTSDDLKKIREDIQKFSESEDTVRRLTGSVGDLSEILKAARTANLFTTMEEEHQKRMAEIRADFKMNIPKIKPLIEYHEENSSKFLLESLQNYYLKWSANMPEDCQVVIYSFLPNGTVVSVTTLTQEGQNGICIEGHINGVECLFLTHQSSFQFLCIAETISQEKPKQKIGFIYEKD